jgi:F-type H+-transporting ATPase subunit delta
MFVPERWAAAFINACDVCTTNITSDACTASDACDTSDAAGEGLAVLKEICPQVDRIPGPVSGTSAAAQLDRMLRTALRESRPSPEAAASPGLAAAFRLIILLVRKGLFQHNGAVIREIEQILDRKRGILPVTVESPFSPDEEFREALKQGLRKKTGAREIKLRIRIVPELLGGCRLRMGSESLDASLKGQIQKMAADLGAAPGGIIW